MQIEPNYDSGNMSVTKKYIRDLIVQHDPALAEVWDELESIGNTNDLVKHNLQQAQIHLQQEQARYYGLETRMIEHLKAIAEAAKDENNEIAKNKVDILIRERNDTQKQLAKSREYIIKLMNTTTSMAKEYRQCMMQQKYIVHMVQVQQFLLALKASLHRNVRDVDALNAISSDMSEMSSSCFSMSEDF